VSERRICARPSSGLPALSQVLVLVPPQPPQSPSRTAIKALVLTVNLSLPRLLMTPQSMYLALSSHQFTGETGTGSPAPSLCSDNSCWFALRFTDLKIRSSMRALSAPTLPAFDTQLLTAAPGTLTRLSFIADTLPYSFFRTPFSQHLRVRVSRTSRCPTSSTCPPPPRLAALNGSPGLTAALAPGYGTLRNADILYNGLRPAALFWRAKLRAEAACTRTRAQCGRAHARTIARRAGEYGQSCSR